MISFKRFGPLWQLNIWPLWFTRNNGDLTVGFHPTGRCIFYTRTNSPSFSERNGYSKPLVRFPFGEHGFRVFRGDT